MKSDFERRAAQDAVDAVEERWRRRHDQDMRMTRRGRRMNLLVFGGLVLLVAGGLFAWQYSQGELSVGIFDVSQCSLVVRRLFGESTDFSSRTSYAALLQGVLVRPVRLLSDMPVEDNPSRAAVGTSFPVLSVSSGGDFSLYRMKADGKGGLSATLCSPFGNERDLTWEAFKSECKKPYLVCIGDVAYLCGSKNVRDADGIKVQVCAALGMPCVTQQEGGSR